jgi:hypothetical protein
MIKSIYSLLRLESKMWTSKLGGPLCIQTVYIIIHMNCTLKYTIIYYFSLIRFSIGRCKSALASRIVRVRVVHYNNVNVV